MPRCQSDTSTDTALRKRTPYRKNINQVNGNAQRALPTIQSYYTNQQCPNSPKEFATKFGIASIGLFCLYLFYDALVSGSFRIGFVWLIVVFLAAKKLVDYENYLSSKDKLGKRKFEYGRK